MGAWGAGLYANDAALDLKAAVSAVCRLPRSGDQLVDLLLEMHPEAADPDDEDRTTFWLVVADLLQKKGIESRARAEALVIIADGSDLAMLEALEMSPSDLRKRAKVLAGLGERLAEPPVPKPRKTLAAPQPLLLAPGEVYAYPIDNRTSCCNPYMSAARRAEFTPAGWGSCLVVGAGHALDVLAWYQLAPDTAPGRDRPTLDAAAVRIDPATNGVGTLSRTHRDRIGLELLGTVDPPAVDPPTPSRVLSVVSSDISAANLLSFWRPLDGVGI
ncbi:MAG: hypothetical protein U0Q07_17025 [Acidimicrobiales bacterium]